MKKIIKKLNNNRGTTNFYAITIIICLLIIFVGVFEFAKVMYTANKYKKEMQLCLDSYTMELGSKGYDRIRRMRLEDISSDFLDYYIDYLDESLSATSPEITYEVTDDKTLILKVKTKLQIPYNFGKTKVSDIDLSLNFVSRFRFK